MPDYPEDGGNFRGEWLNRIILYAENIQKSVMTVRSVIRSRKERIAKRR